MIKLKSYKEKCSKLKKFKKLSSILLLEVLFISKKLNEYNDVLIDQKINLKSQNKIQIQFQDRYSNLGFQI